MISTLNCGERLLAQKPDATVLGLDTESQE